MGVVEEVAKSVSSPRPAGDLRERAAGAATKYDPSIIENAADRLYESGRAAMALYAVIGAVVGGVIGRVAAPRNFDTEAMLGVGVVVGLIGFAIGRDKAIALMVQAQTALCQVQIEKNTRAR